MSPALCTRPATPSVTRFDLSYGRTHRAEIRRCPAALLTSQLCPARPWRERVGALVVAVGNSNSLLLDAGLLDDLVNFAAQE
jgi:hypothetical protein